MRAVGTEIRAIGRIRTPRLWGLAPIGAPVCRSAARLADLGAHVNSTETRAIWPLEPRNGANLSGTEIRAIRRGRLACLPSRPIRKYTRSVSHRGELQRREPWSEACGPSRRLRHPGGRAVDGPASTSPGLLRIMDRKRLGWSTVQICVPDQCVDQKVPRDFPTCESRFAAWISVPLPAAAPVSVPVRVDFRTV